MERRNFLKGVGVIGGVAVSGQSSITNARAASTSFSPISTGSNKGLNSVVTSSVGPVAVGDGGMVLTRDATGWNVRSDTGMAGASKNITSAAVTGDGEFIWMCGQSGHVAVYDIVNDEFKDYSHPNGLTSKWTGIGVTGPARSETVLLVNASGQVVRGTRSSCRSMSWGTTQKPTGGALYGVETNLDGSRFRIIGSSGSVHESTDKGQTWSKIGVPNLGKTLRGAGAGYAGTTSVGGNSGYIADFSTADASWSVETPTSQRIMAVERSGPDGIAAAKNGIILERVDGTWNKIDNSTAVDYTDIELNQDNEYPDIITTSDGSVLERGSFTANPSNIRIQNNSDSTVSYTIDVNGTATKGHLADSADSISSSGTTAEISGGLNTNPNFQDSYGYSGELADVSFNSGLGDEIEMRKAGSPVKPEEIAETTWNTPSVPTSNTLYAIAKSSQGPVAVGGGGKVLARDSGTWTTIVSSGPSGGGNTQNVAESTRNGQNVWFGGSSGTLGVYDVVNDSLSDHTAPSNVTNSWTSMEVMGDSSSELVILGSGSGQILKGRRKSGTMEWQDPSVPATGSAITGIDFATSMVGFFCDSNGDVYKTTDAGRSWTELGSLTMGGTPNDITALSSENIIVSGGSGYISRYDGYKWSNRKFGGNTHYTVEGKTNRIVISGSGGMVRSKNLGQWSTEYDAGATIQDATLYENQNELAIMVGSSGGIYEQSLKENLY